MNVSFFLRDAERFQQFPEKMLTIYYQISVGESTNRTTPASTKRRIPHKYWCYFNGKDPNLNYEGRWVNESYYLAEIINKELMQLKLDLDQAKTVIEYQHGKTTPNEIKKTYQKEDRVVSKTFIEVLEDLIRFKVEEEKIEKSTKRTYNTRKKNFLKYLSSIKELKLSIEDVNFKFIQDFQKFMKSTVNAKGKIGFKKNTINKHVTLIKEVLDYAVNKNYLSASPVAKLFLSYENDCELKYLEPKHRELIKNVKFECFEQYIDVSIFLWNTGLSYCDYLDLKDENLITPNYELISILGLGDEKDIPKLKFIGSKRNKTKVDFLIPVFAETHKIIQKYGGLSKLPKIYLKKFNDNLKFISDIAGVSEKQVGFSLSSSVYRDTFAMAMENEMMLPRSIVRVMMGHTNEDQLNSYSKINPQRMMFELVMAQKQPNVNLMKSFLFAYQSFLK